MIKLNNLSFWEKMSRYSIIVCAVVLIILYFFKKYIYETITLIIIIIGIVALSIFLLSELMKFILKNNKNEN